MNSASPSLLKFGQNNTKKGGTNIGAINNQSSIAHGASGIQMMPSTPEVYKRTKRVLFARRMTLMDRPLLIIEFQGVLGDFVRKPCHGIRDMGAKKPERGALMEQNLNSNGLMLRTGVVDGLKQLSKLFQIVIFSRETIEESWFAKQGG